MAPATIYAAAGALIAAAAAFGMHEIDSLRYGAEIAALNTTLANERQAAATAAQQAEAKYRIIEQTQQEAADAARNQFQAQQGQATAAAAAAARQLDSLRQQLARASAGGGGPAQAAGSGSGADGGTDGAAVLRYVVGECASRYVGVAAAADRLRAQVIGLQGYVSAVSSAYSRSE